MQVYTLQDQNRLARVSPLRTELAQAIDTTPDGILTDTEIYDYVQHDGCRGHHPDGDQEALVSEFKHSLIGRPNPAAEGYHSYESAAAELAQLEQDYPNLCQRVSLGKTAEGRDIWALRISEDVQSESTSSKPGVVITGCHHAREWMSVEIPLHVARQAVTGYGSDEVATQRLKEGEIWIIPIANPDGYAHSRSGDNMWRKNRRPVGQDAMGAPTKAIGIDLNRNYWDGQDQHFQLYRPAGDTPSSTWDDFSATSDNPRKDTYRGPQGASETETQVLMDLAIGHKNIRGVLNHHSYGNMILHPWGVTSKPSDRQAMYEEIGSKMNAAMDNSFTLQSSADLYPASGDSDDVAHVNNLVPFTLEVGRSFQPDPSTIGPMCDKVGRANLVFIDEILARAQAGTLPERV
jgi:carboxypeptidase T